MDKIKNRPVNLDLLHIRMPVMAIVSGLHRITGVLLIVLLPYFVYLFEKSLTSERGFQQVGHLLGSTSAQVFLVLCAWLLSHHFCAGIRFLLIDLDIGVSKPAAIKGAWLVHLAAIGLTLLFAVVLF